MPEDYNGKLDGIFTPNMTIFTNEEVDYRKIEENIEKYNQTSLRGYMPLGSNGEFASLTDDESIKIVDLYAKKKGEKKTLIVGASRESVHSAMNFIKRAADLGAEFASLLPAHYFASKMDDDTLIRFFTKIAGSSPIPIMLYNAPKFCGGLTLTPHVVTECAQHPNIAGMKDTSSEDIKAYIDAVPEDSNFYVLAGTINKFYYGLTVGSIGGVVSLANYLPDSCVELHATYLSGSFEKAAKMDVFLRDLSKRAAGKHGVAGVKAAMDILGYHGGAPRLPLIELNVKQKTELREVLVKEGFVR